MKLSIITINYNNVNGLKKTIDSIVCQTWRDFEWIIIDGGSTDGSKELIEQVAAEEKNNVTYWCSEPDNGIYNAMNKGIDKAKGEWLNFMNSGDFFFCCSTLKSVFSFIDKNNGVDVFYGDHIRYEGETQKIYKSPDVFRFSTLIKYGINHQSSFIKRSMFDDCLYDESLKIVSDWKFFVQCMLKGATFCHISMTICYFEGCGLSMLHSSVIENEKQLVKSSVLSSNLLADIADLESYKKYEEIDEFRDFISQRRLFRRIGKFFIAFAKIVGRVF